MWTICSPENPAHAAVAGTACPRDLQGIDAAAAKDMPGVITVLTGGDPEAAGALGRCNPAEQVNVYSGDPLGFQRNTCCARDRVGYAGEPVALVIAESRSEALDAAEAVAVDYALLPAVVTIQDALDKGDPSVSVWNGWSETGAP